MSAAVRARRLASEGPRSRTERVADTLAVLADDIYAERDPSQRLQLFATSLGFLRARARAEVIDLTGEEP